METGFASVWLSQCLLGIVFKIVWELFRWTAHDTSDYNIFYEIYYTNISKIVYIICFARNDCKVLRIRAKISLWYKTNLEYCLLYQNFKKPSQTRVSTTIFWCGIWHSHSLSKSQTDLFFYTFKWPHPALSQRLGTLSPAVGTTFRQTQFHRKVIAIVRSEVYLLLLGTDHFSSAPSTLMSGIFGIFLLRYAEEIFSRAWGKRDWG